MSRISKSFLGATQLSVQWVPGPFYRVGRGEGSGRSVELTTHLRLVPKSRMIGVMSSLQLYAFIASYLIKRRYSFTSFIIIIIIIIIIIKSVFIFYAFFRQ